MKVLFLDIDGCVNNAHTRQRHRGFIGIDPLLAFRVGKIPLYTDCKVVLSSAWRHFKDGREEVERQVCPMFDVTPHVDGEFRGDEVNAWLAKHPEVTRYAIIDDDSDFYPGQPLFQTSWQTGITDEIMQQIIDYLNRED